MPNFYFTIPADSISQGDPASDVNITVDRGFSRSVKQNVLVAKFGDGYEQRVGNGINTNIENFSISTQNRDADDIYQIAAFFDNTPGESFDFVITDNDGDTTIKVVCEEYNINYIHDIYHSLTAKFRRVYEP